MRQPKALRFRQSTLTSNADFACGVKPMHSGAGAYRNTFGDEHVCYLASENIFIFALREARPHLSTMVTLAPKRRYI